MSEKMAPIHAGEILRELFLEPAGISAYRLAIQARFDPARAEDALHERIHREVRPLDWNNAMNSNC